MQDSNQTPVERGIGVESFDRLHGALQHTALPGYRATRPSTVVATLPILGTRTTYITQTFKTEAYGTVISIEILDAQGPVRIVLPDKVAQAIYRQKATISDRSTPASRAAAARKREREKAKKARAARKQAWAERNGS